MLLEGPREIHFIGASVTAQRESWADRLVEQAAALTGHRHQLTKNAMGGVGLLFGLANYRPREPGTPVRLVFVEFSTGDLNLGLTPLDRLQPWLEHLVARLQAEQAHLVFVHNWRGDFAPDDKPGIRRAYDDVAARHGIPVIANHRLAADAIDQDASARERMFRDVCHTTPDGAHAYARHALQCLQAMAERPAVPAPAVPAAQPARPIEFVDLPDDAFAGTEVSRSQYTYISTGQAFPVRTVPRGLALEMELSGSLLGVAFLSGPRTGWAGLSIDGREVRRFRCFDRNSFYERFILLPAVFDLDHSRVALYDDGSDVDFAIAAKPHPDFALPRQLKLVQLAGSGLVVHSARVVASGERAAAA